MGVGQGANADPVFWKQVRVPLQHGGGFPRPQLHHQEVLASSSDDDEDGDAHEQKNIKLTKKSKNDKTHKKNTKSQKIHTKKNNKKENYHLLIPFL